MTTALLDLRFVKTDKGAAEIRERRFGLHPRLRSILVMVDGSLRGADLASRASALGGGLESVEQLLRDGFIAADAAAQAAPSPTSTAAASALPALPATPAISGDQIGRAKGVLRRYLKVAAMAGDVRALTRRVDAVHDGASLAACAGEMTAFFEADDNAEGAANLRRELADALK
jgi:hypothetical protein